MNLSGRNAIITGANQGLGKAIALAYIKAGANVLLAARKEPLLGEVKDELSALATAQQQIHIQKTDISQADQVTRLVEKAVKEFGRLDILVNNAAIYGPKGLLEEVDWDEWVQAIEINLFGTLLMCRAVLPHFKGNKYGKIINLSGGGASGPFPRFTAYATSKVAIVRITETLAEETRDYNIDANTLAPGALNTQLLDEVIEAGPEKVGEAFHKRMIKIKADGGAPLGKGANLAVYLGSAESDGLTGKMISAIWDPWEKFNDHRSQLEGSDIYTLRRIVPKDRGQEWGEV